MTRGFWRDPERYLDTYWRRLPGIWVHGDWASVDEDGYWFLHGRSDDTLNIAGKRLGPAELESAVVAHPSVAEAAAVGVPHEVKGEVAWVFCALVPGAEPSDELAAELRGLRGRRARQGVRARSACCSSRRCRRRAARRSSGARFARRRSGQIPATSRPWRTPRPWRRSSMSQPADRLDGQVALVTGGGRGIGAGHRARARGRRRARRGRGSHARAGRARRPRDRRRAARGGRERPRVRRRDGHPGRERARADRPARRQRRHRRPGRADLGGRSRRVVAASSR